MHAPQISERPVLCLASSHPEDEDVAISALEELSPETLLIIVPRRVERSAEIVDKINTAGFSHSVGDGPLRKQRVHLVDQVGNWVFGTDYVPMSSGVVLTKPKGIIRGRP